MAPAGRYNVLLLAVLFLAGCGMFSCESPLEREQRELRKAGESPEALIYRGLKVGLRSTPGVVNQQAPDSDTRAIHRLTADLIAEVSNRAGPENGTTADPSQAQPVRLSSEEYLQVAADLYRLRKKLRNVDEDEFPTLLAHLLAARGQEVDNAGLMTWYNSDYEHLFLAVAWLAARPVPTGVRIYETGQINPAEITEISLRMGAHLVRGVTFFQEGWPLLCEIEATEHLQFLETERPSLLDWAREHGEHIETASGSDDELMATLHAPGVLLRGLCRQQSEQADPALQDFEAFLEDAETLGLDTEAVWLIGAYVGIRRDDPERALENLRKLEQSPLLEERERETVTEIIEAVEQRDPEAALNKVTDKAIIARIVGGYLFTVLSDVEWRQALTQTETGAKLVTMSDVIAREVKTLREKLSPDQVKDLGVRAADHARDTGGTWWRKTLDAIKK